MFARCGATILYLYPAIGQVAATIDIIHMVTGFPLETASVFRVLAMVQKDMLCGNTVLLRQLMK